ncbi:F-box/LRR-repeat protein 21-like [Lytechinus pictus]|uniref:F-box/LRR-repeat protein 21-like n=1 Tax=Lytechinus pictus TaxID=7653 RepID=UPI00240E6A53|nr:F-box/LRR-repeat protein 21-like [Lytechinus pictus]
MAYSSPFMKAVTTAKDPMSCIVGPPPPPISSKKVIYTPFSRVTTTDKKQCIRGLIYKNLASSSANHCQLNWSNIPDVVLIKIYKNLSFLDRARASSVCKHWHDIYKLPELWHKFEFEFTQESTSYIKSTPPRLVKQVIQQYTKHLKYVTIKVDSHQASAEAACDILSRLVNCSLKTLELMLTARPSFHLVNPVKLLTPLTVVLVNSPTLSSLALDETPVDDPWLENMAVSNKDSLMLLKIASCPLVSSKGMLHVADTCRQLHELNINYVHVSDSLLLALSREEHVKLKHLCVNVICENNDTPMQHHVIKKQSWDALASHSPSTIVSMCFYVLRDTDFTPFFTYVTPATHVYFGRSVSRDVLIRMGENCPKLQELVICANGNQPLDEPIVTIARKCKELHSLGLGECEVSCSCLVKVARLCGERLTEFFVREEVVFEDDEYDLDTMTSEVCQYLGRTWSAECMPFWNE